MKAIHQCEVTLRGSIPITSMLGQGLGVTLNSLCNEARAVFALEFETAVKTAGWKHGLMAEIEWEVILILERKSVHSSTRSEKDAGDGTSDPDAFRGV